MSVETFADLVEWLTEKYANVETDYEGSVWVNVCEDNECVLLRHVVGSDDLIVEFHDWDGDLILDVRASLRSAPSGLSVLLDMWFNSSAYDEGGEWAMWVRSSNCGEVFRSMVGVLGSE